MRFFFLCNVIKWYYFLVNVIIMQEQVWAIEYQRVFVFLVLCGVGDLEVEEKVLVQFGQAWDFGCILSKGRVLLLKVVEAFFGSVFQGCKERGECGFMQFRGLGSFIFEEGVILLGCVRNKLVFGRYLFIFFCEDYFDNDFFDFYCILFFVIEGLLYFRVCEVFV